MPCLPCREGSEEGGLWNRACRRMSTWKGRCFIPVRGNRAESFCIPCLPHPSSVLMALVDYSGQIWLGLLSPGWPSCIRAWRQKGGVKAAWENSTDRVGCWESGVHIFPGIVAWEWAVNAAAGQINWL